MAAHPPPRVVKMEAECLYLTQEMTEAAAKVVALRLVTMMFWLFSFRNRAASHAGYSWRPALGAPNGRAIAALMTFSGN